MVNTPILWNPETGEEEDESPHDFRITAVARLRSLGECDAGHLQLALHPRVDLPFERRSGRKHLLDHKRGTDWVLPAPGLDGDGERPGWHGVPVLRATKRVRSGVGL